MLNELLLIVFTIVVGVVCYALREAKSFFLSLGTLLGMLLLLLTFEACEADFAVKHTALLALMTVPTPIVVPSH